jgi:hypothetical protein
MQMNSECRKNDRRSLFDRSVLKTRQSRGGQPRSWARCFATTRGVSIAALVVMVCACATSHVMIGKARPAISPEQVRIYDRPPVAYEEIARLDTSSQGSFSFTAQRKTDAVIKRLKIEAAKLGANGVLIEGIGDRTTGSIGTGGGGDSFSGGSSFGGGIGLSTGIKSKVGGGLAIYVQP